MTNPIGNARQKADSTVNWANFGPCGYEADVLNRLFSSVFTKENLATIPQMNGIYNGPLLEDVVITPEEVTDKPMSLNPDKSPGQDQIHPRVLKEVSGPISVPLSQIFRKSLENGRLPEQWKEANVTPIFKKGSRKEPGNYRPISLTSVPRKVMESFIRCSLGSLLTEAQYGFLPKESCEAQLLSCMEAWTDMMERGVPSIGLILGHAGNFVPP